MNQRLGQQVNAYQLKRLLEAGDTVEKYLGEHVRTQAEATINLFRTPMTDSEAFLRLAQKLARIVHPHLVRILDFGVHEDRPFLVVEYFPASLRQLYPPGAQVPLEVVMGYVQQIGSALQYTHDQGEVHGDLRPEHLLLRPGGQGIVISDLGRLALEHTITSIPNNLSPYMGPEQAEEEPQPASDQYALAKIITEWLSGERTTVGSDIEPIAGIPEMLLAVLGMGQAQDSQRRFRSLQTFLNALKQAGGQNEQTLLSTGREPAQLAKPLTPIAPLATTPTIPAPSGTIQQPAPSQSPQTPLPLQGPQTPLADFPLPPPPPPPSPYPPPVSVTNGASAQRGGISRRALLISGGTGLAVLALGGGLVAYLKLRPGAASPANIPPTLVYTYTDQQEFTNNDIPLEDFTGNSKQFFWSPNSQRIATLSGVANNITLDVWDASNGGHPSTWTATDVVWDMTWEENNLHVAWLDDKKTIHILDVASKKELLTYAQPEAEGFSWSPNGQRMASISEAFTETSDGGVVIIWDAATGANTVSFTAPSDGLSTGFPNNAPQNGLLWSPNSNHLLSWGYNTILYVLDAQSGTIISTYRNYWEQYARNDPHDQAFLQHVQWSPDSQFLVTNAIGENVSDSTLHVWNASTGQEVSVYRGHISNSIHQVAWSPDSRLIASQGSDNFVHIWDATTGTRLFIHPTGEEPCLAWKPGTRRVASNSSGTSFQVWDATTGANVDTYGKYNEFPTPDGTGASGDYLGANLVTWSPNGQYIAALDNDIVYIWEGGQ